MAATKALLVDFDGTLIDSLPCLKKTYELFLQFYQKTSSESEFRSLNGPSTSEIVEILRTKHLIRGSHADLYHHYTQIMQDCYQHSEPFDDTEEFLKDLSKARIKLILATSSRSSVCKPLIKKFSWEKYFYAYVWGEEFTQSKPAPDIYLEALTKSECASTDVYAIEDAPNGVKSAVQAGIRTIGKANRDAKSHLMDAGATTCFNSLSSIKKFILEST